MEENPKDPVNNGKKTVERNPDGTIKSGVLNPNGKPKGTESFATKFYKVIDKLAKQNDLTPDEIEEQLILVGYKKAKEGDYSFYKDLHDRVHGKPLQQTDLTSKGEKIEFPTAINIIKPNDDRL